MGKSIVDNKTGVPLAHYQKRYQQINPVEASQRSGIFYDANQQCFQTILLGKKILISYPDLMVTDENTGEKLPPNATILLARLILEGQLIETQGKFLAYNEMPWGELYHGNFRGRCIQRFIYSFGHSFTRLDIAARALGGEAVNAGDAAFDLSFVPGLMIRLILWEADEEFAPSAQILFSDNFPAAWSAEDMAVVGDILIDELKKIY